MLDLQSSDLNALLAHVAATLPPDPAAWPGGWPDQIEAALIDAVLSIRARYGSPATGVRRRVRLYLAHRGNPANDLTILAASDPQALATVLDSKSRTGGQLKAAAIVEAAHALVEAGVTRAADLDPGSVLQRSAYCDVKGLGPVTWCYLLMLTGHPGVKADRWLSRYVAQAVGRAMSPTEVERLVTAAAAALRLDPTDLDHAIWALMSRTRD